MKRKVIKKLPVLLAIMFVLFQSFLVPLASASWTGTPWKGETWDGDSWTGDAWNTDGFSWEGEAWNPGKGWIQDGWEQDGWTQEGFTQDGWNQNGWNQPGYTQDGWNQNGWNQPGYTQNGWNQNGWNQPGYTQNGWNQNNWNQPGYMQNGWNQNNWNQPGYTQNGWNQNNWNQPGYMQNGWNQNNWNQFGYNQYGWAANPLAPINPLTGQPWSQNGYAGNSLTGTAGNPPPIPQKSTSGIEYGLLKYMVNDVIGGQVKFVNAMEKGNFSLMKPNSFYGLVMNGLKLGLGDSSTGFNAAYDIYNVADKTNSVNNAVTTLRTYSSIPNAQVKSYGVVRSALSNATIANGTAPALGVLGKLNLATAGIGTFFSAIDTVKNTGKAIEAFKGQSSGAEKTAAVAGATESFGSLLMSSGAMVSAIPGVQAVGAVMVIGGAAIWGTSKLVKWGAKNWNNIKSSAKGLWKSVKGAFT